MASTPFNPFDSWFVQPLPPRRWLGVAVAVWIVGAVYCAGYKTLVDRDGDFAGSLIWSAYSIVPWFALAEEAKRPRAIWARRLPTIAVALALVAALSVSTEIAIRLASGDGLPPLAFMIMRRMPALGVAALLILMARRLIRAPVGDKAAAELRLCQASPAVLWLAAADNYVELNFGDRTELLRMTMADAQRILAPRGFRRIHRRYIVNAGQITGVTPDRSQVRLRDGTKLPTGKAYITELRAIG